MGSDDHIQKLRNKLWETPGKIFLYPIEFYLKALRTFSLSKDGEGYSAEFEDYTRDKRPSRDKITGKYSADRYSKEGIEKFIKEIGEIAEENLTKILEVETVRSMPDKDLKELNDMAINDYEPVFDIKRDSNKIIQIKGRFPNEELLEALNKVLEDLNSTKRIFLYNKSKILVLNDEEEKSLKSKFGSRFRKSFRKPNSVKNS